MPTKYWSDFMVVKRIEKLREFMNKLGIGSWKQGTNKTVSCGTGTHTVFSATLIRKGEWKVTKNPGI